jgi:hypothetical protein
VNRLEHALALARQGLLIFPLRPRVKTPYQGDAWKEMMTTDEAAIRKWFADRPDMNYAVCGGDKFMILDPDVDASQEKDGLATLVEMETSQDPGDWVSEGTFEVRSPRGGRHLYLRSPQPVACSIGTFAPGIDVRGGLKGSEGYVVGPGCFTDEDAARNTAEGEYVVVGDRPIADAPAWVMQRVATSTLARSKDSDVSLIEWDLPGQIDRARELIRQQTTWPTEGEGGDNNTYHFCTLMRDLAVTPETCFDVLHEPLYDDGGSWNEHCEPSWEDRDLWRKINNAYRYGKNQPGSKGGVMEEQAEYGADAAEQAEKAVRLLQFSKLVELTFPGDSLTARIVHREMVIPEWMPMHGVTQVLSKRGTGKTILDLDIAMRVGNDMDWHGSKLREGMTAIYACGEDDEGFQEQMKAWLSVHKKHPDPQRFITIAAVPNLMDASDVQAWCEYIRTIVPDGAQCIFFLDTWQRATSRASQNDEEQMNLATDHAEAIAKVLRGPVVANFHPPKHNEGTISGSQVIENKGNTIWSLTKGGNGISRVAKVLRIKGKGEGNEKSFDWREVSWGEVDDFGDKRTGIVPCYESGTGMAESQDSIQNRVSARHLYASIMEEIIAAHYNNGIKRSSSDFGLTDMSRRLRKFFDTDPHNGLWKSKLQAAHDFRWSNDEQSLRKHLASMFGESDPPQRTETGQYVQFVRRGRKDSYFDIVEAPKKSSVVSDDTEMADIEAMI